MQAGLVGNVRRTAAWTASFNFAQPSWRSAFWFSTALAHWATYLRSWSVRRGLGAVANETTSSSVPGGNERKPRPRRN